MLHYYGTNLDSYGHFFFDLEDHTINHSRKNFGNIPFDPEKLPHPLKKGYYNKDGYTQFYRVSGYTICAITGSCKDLRPGSKSVFFVDSYITNAEMRDKILFTEIAKKIINQMTFEVIWPSDTF